MSTSITDFGQFTSLRAAADQKDPAALREVAGQFEALFIQMMLKNMRAASFGDPLMGDSQQHELYTEMMDKQLALDMASGRGIGLADKIIEQLGGTTAPDAGSPDDAIPVFQLPTRPAAQTVSEFQAQRGSDVINVVTKPTASATAAADTPDASAKPDWTDPESFAKAVWPHVKRAAEFLNVSPVAVLAQTALVTGWGSKVMPDADGGSSFNLFGIKAGGGWAGDSVAKSTLEFDSGVARRETANFRAYPDVSGTFDDYASFLAGNPRYADVVGKGDDVAGFAQALQDSGYATDPQYARKIKAIFDGPTMRRVMDGLAVNGL
ncbi:MAG: flagellar assembly peptidoglycan hydrolase FlgJ [Pseudomonadota bacterium]